MPGDDGHEVDLPAARLRARPAPRRHRRDGAAAVVEEVEVQDVVAGGGRLDRDAHRACAIVEGRSVGLRHQVSARHQADEHGGEPQHGDPEDSLAPYGGQNLSAALDQARQRAVGAAAPTTKATVMATDSPHKANPQSTTDGIAPPESDRTRGETTAGRSDGGNGPSAHRGGRKSRVRRSVPAPRRARPECS